MSTKTVAEKLLIKPGTRVWISDRERRTLIEPLPDGVGVTGRLADASVAVVVADDAASLRAILAAHADEVREPAVVWVAYPKANRTDINRDTVWPIVVAHGLRPVGQVAVDEVWSALRFRAQKPGEAPFTGGR